jgi:hypothetical protein
MDEFQVPEDFFSSLNEAAEIAGEQATVELEAGARLYLFEFSKITKTGGVNGPFVTKNEMKSNEMNVLQHRF